MRQIVRTTAIATILATVLTATPALAADRAPRTRRDRGTATVTVTQMIQQILQRVFGVSIQSGISIPVPEDSEPSSQPSSTTGS